MEPLIPTKLPQKMMRRATTLASIQLSEPAEPSGEKVHRMTSCSGALRRANSVRSCFAAMDLSSPTSQDDDSVTFRLEESPGAVLTWSEGTAKNEILGRDGARDQALPLEMPSATQVKAITCGAFHTLVLCTDHLLYSYGQGTDGQLGHGVFEDVSRPKLIETMKHLSVQQISAGRSHSAVTLEAEGRRQVWTWGQNMSKQLGREVVPTEADTPVEGGVNMNKFRCPTPAPVIHEVLKPGADHPSLLQPTALSAGDDHTATIDADGSIWAWGCTQSKSTPQLVWGRDKPQALGMVTGSLITLIICADGVHVISAKLGQDGLNDEGQMVFDNSLQHEEAASVHFCRSSQNELIVLTKKGHLYMVLHDMLEDKYKVCPKELIPVDETVRQVTSTMGRLLVLTTNGACFSLPRPTPGLPNLAAKPPTEQDRRRVASVLPAERIFHVDSGAMHYAVMSSHVGYPPLLVEALEELFQSGPEDLCDVVFEVGANTEDSATLKAHRVLVAAVESAFSHQLLEAPDQTQMSITLPDTDAKTFRLLLHFIYVGPTAVMKHFWNEGCTAQPFVQSLFLLADMAESFGMDSLSASVLEVLARLVDRMWSLMSNDQKKVHLVLLTTCQRRADVLSCSPELLELCRRCLAQCCLFALADALTLTPWKTAQDASLSGVLSLSARGTQEPADCETHRDSEGTITLAAKADLSNDLPKSALLHVSISGENPLVFGLVLDAESVEYTGQCEMIDGKPQLRLQNGEGELVLGSENLALLDALNFLSENDVFGATEAANSCRNQGGLPYVAGMASLAKQARPPTSLLTALKSGSFTDMIVVAEGREFQVHRAVLVARSPYFAAMHQGGMKEASEGRVELPGWSARVIGVLLEWLYCGVVTIHSDDLVALLLATDLFQAATLHAQCRRILLEQLCADNACTLATIGEMLGGDSGEVIYDQARDCVDKNLASVLESDAFKELPADSRIAQHIAISNSITKPSAFSVGGGSKPASHTHHRRRHKASMRASPAGAAAESPAQLFGAGAADSPLFGAPAAGTPLFGSPVGTCPQGSTGLFGAPANDTGLFGSTAVPPSGGLFSFGQANQPAQPSSFTFGQPDQAAVAAAAPFSFGDAGNQVQVGAQAEAAHGSEKRDVFGGGTGGLQRMRSINEEEV